MTIAFFGSWAIRSAALILCGDLIVRAVRVKDPAIRLAACQAMLAASLAIPVLTSVGAFHALPITPLPGSIAIPAAFHAPSPLSRLASGAPAHSQGLPFDWDTAAGVAYLAVSLFLLLRLATGAALSLRLLSGSRSTERSYGSTDVRESDRIVAPVTLGIIRPKKAPGPGFQPSEASLPTPLW